MQFVRANRLLMATGAVFSPLTLGAGLYAAWDPETSGSLDLVGGAVRTWTDYANGAAPTQGLGASRPAYGLSGFNGRPVITPDGVDDQLTLSVMPSSIPRGATPFEVWVIWNQTKLVADTNPRIAISWGGGVSNYHCGVARAVVAGVNRAQVYVGTGAAQPAAYSSVDFSGRRVLRAVVDGTNIRIDVGGIAGTPVAAVPNIGNTTLRLFAHSVNPSVFGAGDFSGIFITRLLSAAEALNMYSYCNRRIA